MSRKLVIWFGLFAGSTVGGLVPLIWGGSLLSISSIFWGGVGGIVGIWLSWQYAP